MQPTDALKIGDVAFGNKNIFSTATLMPVEIHRKIFKSISMLRGMFSAKFWLGWEKCYFTHQIYLVLKNFAVRADRQFYGTLYFCNQKIQFLGVFTETAVYKIVRSSGYQIRKQNQQE